MACTIVSNNIASPQLRESISNAVIDGIGERSGNWKITVYQALDYPAFGIRINGPENLRWEWSVYENEQSPEIVRERVAQGIASKLSLLNTSS